MGIPVEWINTLAWGISAAVAGLAAVLLAPLTFVHVNMGFLGFKAFPAAVIGGLGSIPGAVVGGILLGIVESLSGFYAPEGVKDVIAYLVVLAVLIVRPSGLFGETTKKKV
jgi:branched-chain amino acid transport system permease protein